MSFSFSFTITDQGTISQTEQEAGTLESAVKYGLLKPGQQFNVNGHTPSGPADWGASLSIHAPGLGTTAMSSQFLRQEVPTQPTTTPTDPPAA